MKVGSFTIVAVGAGANQELVGPNIKRIGLRFGPAGGAAFSVSNAAMTAATQGDTSYSSAFGPLMTYEDYGELIRSPWFAFAAGATQVAVYEVTEA